MESAHSRLNEGFPDPPDEDTAYEVACALDEASDRYTGALGVIAQGTESALTQLQAEEVEAAVAAAEDALQLALQAAKQKVRDATVCARLLVSLRNVARIAARLCSLSSRLLHFVVC